MAICWFDGWTSTAAIKISGSNVAGAVAHVQKAWGEINPQAPFSYAFMDETVGKLYTAETRLAQILRVFVILAVFLSCLGLFGLSAFVAAQKTKEIGIRKVLGRGHRKSSSSFRRTSPSGSFWRTCSPGRRPIT